MNLGDLREEFPALQPQGPTIMESKQQSIVASERRAHILDGDKTGGGHRPGTGIPGKSEFPSGWTDDKIIKNVEDVANDSASARNLQQNGRTSVEGTRDGVAIRVIVNPDGSIQTAHPLNTARNP